MTTQEKIETITQHLDEMSIVELVYLHQNYCSETENFDDEIYDIDQIDELFAGRDPYWILCRGHYGDFDPMKPFFEFDGYGNLRSLATWEAIDQINPEEIAEWIVEHNNCLWNDEIEEILNENDDF